MIINAPLIIYFKSLGAVIASSVAETIIGVLYAYKTRHLLNIRFICLDLIKKVFAGLIMVIAVSMASRFLSLGTVLSLVIQMILGGFVYTTVLILIKDKSVYEVLKFIKEKVKRNG